MKSILIFTLASTSFTVLATDNHIKLDGQLNETAWQNAKTYRNFYQVVPATLSQHKDKVEGRVFASNEGLYVGIKNYQKQGQRKKQYNLQDAFMQADFNRFIIDFSGDGSGAYLFAVTLGGGIQDAALTPQLSSDYDWDGTWQSAYFEAEDFWSIEAFIPWHSVSFRHQQDANGYSQIGVSLQLYDLAKNYIYGSQPQTTGNSDFYIEMPRVKVKIPKTQQWAFVPYVSGTSDLVNNENDANLGFDLVYKPSHHQKLSLAVNPDFGQVDSDEVVLNYSAVETLRTDKRPFFTQDIGVFNVPAERNTKLIHTRRIGAGSDDGSENITPIDMAARFVHQGEHVQFAGFAVTEDSLDSGAGKDFYAARATYKQSSQLSNWQAGLLTTKTSRPWLNREALTYAFDTQFQSEHFSADMTLMGTDIDTQARSTQGVGFSTKVKYQHSVNTSLQASHLKLDNEFDNNDLGYSERNNWRYSDLVLNHAVNTESDWYNRVLHRAMLSYQSNDEGLKLGATQQYLVNFNLNNGGQFETILSYISGGWQDNLGYQSDAVHIDGHWNSRVMYISPYTGTFSWAASYQNDQEGLNGRADQFAVDLTWMPHANWRVEFNNYFRTGDGWLVANQQNQISQYDRDYFVNYVKVAGLVTDNLELSTTFQWADLRAESKDVYTLVDNALVSQNLDTSFNDSQFNFQFKLRYKMGAFSDVYFVYGRGGNSDNLQDLSDKHSRFNTLERIWQQREQEFLTLKVRYLF